MLGPEAAVGALAHHAGRLPLGQQAALARLERQAQPPGEPEDAQRHREEADAQGPGQRLHGQVEDEGEDVLGPGEQQHGVAGDGRRAQRRTDGPVPRAVAQVALPRRAGDPAFEEGVGVQGREEYAGQQYGRHQGIPHDRVTPQPCLHAGHQAQGAFEEPDVPVGLGSGGDHVGAVGAVVPDGVDLRDRPEGGEQPEDREEQPRGLGHVLGEERQADDVAAGPAGSRPLSVLQGEHEQDVHGDQAQQQAGDQQDVQGVEPGHDVVPGILAAEGEEAQVRAGDRDRQHDPLGDPQPGARQQVVGERVPGEALQQGQQEQRHAHQPVDFTGAAEGAGEEHPQQVRPDGGQEEQRRPVVDLADEQPAAHVEADLQGGEVGLRHEHPAQRRVGALVGRLPHRRVEEEGEVHAGQQQHDEAVERQFAQEERPVVGEDLADHRPGRLGQRKPRVQRLGPPDHRTPCPVLRPRFPLRTRHGHAPPVRTLTAGSSKPPGSHAKLPKLALRDQFRHGGGPTCGRAAHGVASK